MEDKQTFIVCKKRNYAAKKYITKQSVALLLESVHKQDDSSFDNLVYN